MTNTGMTLRSSSGSSRHRHGSSTTRSSIAVRRPSTIPITSPSWSITTAGVLVWPTAGPGAEIGRVNWDLGGRDRAHWPRRLPEYDQHQYERALSVPYAEQRHLHGHAQEGW